MVRAGGGKMRPGDDDVEQFWPCLTQCVPYTDFLYSRQTQVHIRPAFVIGLAPIVSVPSAGIAVAALERAGPTTKATANTAERVNRAIITASSVRSSGTTMLALKPSKVSSAVIQEGSTGVIVRKGPASRPYGHFAT